MNCITIFKHTHYKEKKSLYRIFSGNVVSLFCLLMLFASTSFSQADCSQVPSSISGFIYMGEHNGSKYFCSDGNNFNWSEATAAAANHGGYLVSIQDQAENDFVKNGLIANTAWIGYTDEDSEGNFEWEDGSNSSYTNWSSGEPNNQGVNGGQGDYAVMDKSSGKWKDRDGNDDYEFVMEIPCPTVPSGPCMDQLAHWDLNACSAGSSYSEFTANTATPSGFMSVSATNLTNSGDHSCTPSPFDKGICHEIRENCSFSNNHSDAYKFTVTIKPQSGESVTLSKLWFYEAAPANYTWTNGQSGDNDPPSKYGIRVTVNGTQVYKQVDIPTSGNWSLEQFDFTNDPDFTVSSETTFAFELLGYCRQGGTSGPAVWDIDEIKVFGCKEDPCANAGGDNDGDGVCDDDDCAPNNPNLPTTPGTACNDGDPNTVNDMIQADGCTCAGTFDPCAANGGDSDGDGVCDDDDCAPNNPNLPTAPGTACNDGDPNTSNDMIQADGCTCAGTPVGPCDNAGGDSDGDGVCNDDDCAPFNANLPTTPGTACNDGDPNTTNDMIQSDGCTCAGTPVGPCDNAGGDSDGDGVCNDDDCAPFNANLPTTPGTACNDGNPNTINDVIQADGCTCMGEPDQGDPLRPNYSYHFFWKNYGFWTQLTDSVDQSV